MVKKIFLLIFGILASITVQAQSAQEFFNNMIDKIKSYQDMSFVFNYSIISEDADLNEKMNGYASIKGDSYLLNLGDQVMISNGKLVWNYLIDEQEVMISEATEDNIAIGEASPSFTPMVSAYSSQLTPLPTLQIAI